MNVIKCVYYGGQVSSDTALNKGASTRDFRTVIAGSDGYVANSIATPAGFGAPQTLGNVAINAPQYDCNGNPTYMGVKIFTTGAFDIGLCAAACTATSNYNLLNPPATGVPQLCQFYNTFILYKNLKAVGQYCAMYSETWPRSFATNVGQYNGNDHYTLGYSCTCYNSRILALMLDHC